MVATTLLATTLPVALSVVATRLAPLTLPAVDIFPPVMLPLTLTTAPVKLAVFTMVVNMPLLAVMLPESELDVANTLAMILLAVTLPVTLRPAALENVAIAVGVIAPDAVVYICMLVALLVSVKFSAATMSTRPVDALPNCKEPLLNPRPVNCVIVAPDCVCVGAAPVPLAVRPVNALYARAPNASCTILVLSVSAPEICTSVPLTVLLPVIG